MQCRSVEQRIQGLLDDHLDPSFDSELIEHASTCEACGDLLQVQGQLFNGLQTLPVPALSAGFSHRVVGLVVMQRRRSVHRTATAVAALATIATLLLVVVLGPMNGQKDPMRKIASTVPSRTTHASLMQLPVGGFDSRDVRLAVEQFVASLTSGKRSGFYHVEQLAGTIRPLASTLNVAFDAIRRSIPRRRDTPQPDPQASDLRILRALYLI